MENQTNTLEAFKPGGILAGLNTPQVATPSVSQTASPEVTKPQLDPQIVTLAQSIRQNESGGNFHLRGASGEYGAYQFTPDTWNGASKKYGINTPLDKANPEQQNEVAYKQLADWKIQHPDWNIGNFASAWNAGEGKPNAYQENFRGVNNYGVQYDTPAYAEKVAKTYQKLKANQPITNEDGSTQIDQPTLEKHTADLSSGEKLLLGLGIPLTIAAGAFTGGASEALVPEEIAALGGETAGATGIGAGLLSKVKNIPGVAKVLGVEGLIDEGKKILGLGDNSKANADEQANATVASGDEQANATQQAETAHEMESEQQADEQRSREQIQQAETLGNALNQSLPLTQAGRILQQQPQTQDALKTMGQYGLAPDTSSGFDDYSMARRKSEQLKEDLSNGVAKVLDTEGVRGNIHEAIQEAYSNIDKYVPTHERASAKKYVDEIAHSYNQAGGNKGHISLGDMERGKREQYRAVGKFDATRPSAKTAAHKSFAHGLRKTIEKNTSHKDLYNRVMKEEQKLFAADKIMKHRNGKKSLEHKGFYRGILKNYGKYVGLAIGDKLGGPLGAVVGTMVGDHLVKAVDKRFGKTYFESKEGKKLIEIASKQNPAVAKTLKKVLERYGVRAEEMKKEAEAKKFHMGAESEISKKSHEAKKEKKREEYKKKKGIIPESKKSEYEPIIPNEKLPVIPFGKKSKDKNKKIVKGLPIIR